MEEKKPTTQELWLISREVRVKGGKKKKSGPSCAKLYEGEGPRLFPRKDIALEGTEKADEMPGPKSRTEIKTFSAARKRVFPRPDLLQKEKGEGNKMGTHRRSAFTWKEEKKLERQLFRLQRMEKKTSAICSRGRGQTGKTSRTLARVPGIP